MIQLFLGVTGAVVAAFAAAVGVIAVALAGIGRAKDRVEGGDDER